MSRRGRIGTFGGTALLVAAGIVCAAVFSSEAGQLVGFALIGVGLILATSLVFLEVGLSEDRERAREAKAAADSARPSRRRALGGTRRQRRPE
jgi:hypothetical protein